MDSQEDSYYEGDYAGVAVESTDPSMPALPPLLGDDDDDGGNDVDVDDRDGDVDDKDGDDDDDKDEDNYSSPSTYSSSGGPMTAAAAMATTSTTSTTSNLSTAIEIATVSRTHKSTLHFRTDLTKSSRDVHPRGVVRGFAPRDV